MRMVPAQVPTYPRPWVNYALVLTSIILLLSAIAWDLFPGYRAFFVVDRDARLPLRMRSPEEFTRAARRFEHADPVADARQALLHRDTRLWGGESFGVYIPGAPEVNVKSYERIYGVRLFYSGCASSVEEQHYRQSVEAYAERYNQTILGAVER